MRQVPYFSQWETANLAPAIIANQLTLAEDPAWASSGAKDQAEYLEWANHICGMACLKMILAACRGKVHPTLELVRRSLPYGAYRLEGQRIIGLIYAPFVTFVAEEFGLAAEIKLEITAADLPGILEDAGFFMASVHPWIRWPERQPPSTGGHLVLVTAASERAIVFHNPSGERPETQANATLPLANFQRFFAGRGVAIGSG
jgi:hypothetical protein